MITKKIKPGQAGTKKLKQEYGNQLLCVRYRYDSEKKKKYKTVEIIIYEDEWCPGRNRILNNDHVYLKILYGEVELGRAIRNAGGFWDRTKKLWKILNHRVGQFY